MKILLLISAICSHLSWIYGYPGGPQGVGAYAYQDSAGNRYGGTYGLKDGQVFNTKGDDFPVPFAVNTFQDLDDFFPEYFRNFENLLQEAFRSNFENQRLAYNAARKAFDLTSNQAGYIQNFASRFTPPRDFPGYFGFGSAPDFDMSGFGSQNSAYARAAAGPGYTHHSAAISPNNPNMANVDVTNSDADGEADKPHFYSVSSSSYATSSNVNGQQMNQRGAETVVNKDGKVTKYKVHS